MIERNKFVSGHWKNNWNKIIHNFIIRILFITACVRDFYASVLLEMCKTPFHIVQMDNCRKTCLENVLIRHDSEHDFSPYLRSLYKLCTAIFHHQGFSQQIDPIGLDL